MNLKKSKQSFAIIGDLHIGCRGASTVLSEYQLMFFDEVLFPYMEKHGITTILQLGDLFDTRKFSNHVILHQWKTRFFDELKKRDYKMITLLGNHDISTKNSLSINSPKLFLSDYDNITIIDTPTELEIEGVGFLLVPWICDENYSLVEETVKNSSAIFCAGHFEFEGFEMQPGVPSHGGMLTENYSHFDTIFSGHYHTKSKKKNVQYVGTPFEQNWADYNDQKGFFVFDTKSNEASFVKNPHTLFVKCSYDDADDKEPKTPSITKNSYIKVIVVNKTDPYKFEKFLTAIISQGPSDLKITEVDQDFEDTNVDASLKLDDTPTLISKFIDQCETKLSKDKLKQYMSALYVHSLEICD